MKSRITAVVLLTTWTAFAGTLSVTFVKNPSGTSASSGTYSNYGDGAPLSWSGFGATADANDGTVVTTGLLTCSIAGGCGGGTPARFRVEFVGSDFSTVDIDLQGTLTSLAPLPDVQAYLYGTVHTVIFTGMPSYNGNGLIEPGSSQILSMTTSFGLDNPTNGKETITTHEVTGDIPAGNFYGYTVLTIEQLTGQFDFNDPLTNNFATANVPEPGTALVMALGLAMLAMLKRRL